MSVRMWESPEEAYKYILEAKIKQLSVPSANLIGNSMKDTTLNKLPDGSNSPQYFITAISHSGIEAKEILREWWHEGKLVQSIEQSAEEYFYERFDKEAFSIISIYKLPS